MNRLKPGQQTPARPTPLLAQSMTRMDESLPNGPQYVPVSTLWPWLGDYKAQIPRHRPIPPGE